MTSQLIEQAAEKVGSVPILVNVISRRVRQLSVGHHRPRVDVPVFTSLGDIALMEVLEDKVQWTADEEVKVGV